MMQHIEAADSPLISIMMPAKNSEAFLHNTIESIIHQTYKNWELIFVNDGSTDLTLNIISSFSENDERIKVINISHGGRGVARNECIRNATGKYVAVCDSDDIFFPDRFEKQVAYLEANPNIGVVGSYWIPFSGCEPTPADSVVRRFNSNPDDIKRAFERRKMRFHNATAMIRRELFDIYGVYNTELKRAQDYEFYSRLNSSGVQFSIIEEPLIYYRWESKVPRLSYFIENGMFMSYADKLVNGQARGFDVFSGSIEGSLWRLYYTIKYVYFYLKMSSMNLLEK